MHTDEYFLNVRKVLNSLVGVNMSAGHNLSCETKSRLSGDNIVHLLQKQNSYYRFLNSSPTERYPEPDESKFNFNFILLSVSESPKWSLFKDFGSKALYSFVIFRYLKFETFSNNLPPSFI
jgi:hypothetical protein